MGWIGVDLDGTLAKYDGYKGPTHIGEPVPEMLSRVKQWIEDGLQLKIFTARVGPQKSPDDARASMVAIREWCQKHLGRALPVTATKDYAMVQLWDDRCTQVIPNTGVAAVDDAKAQLDSHVLAMANSGLELCHCPVCKRPYYRKTNYKPGKEKKTCGIFKCAMQFKWLNDGPVDMNKPVSKKRATKNTADLQYHGQVPR